jgi:hypothetical protein
MTAANHMITGAVIAAAVQRPLLVVPLALISHFILDVFPHFGVHHKDNSERNTHPLFKAVLLIDVLLVFVLLAGLPLLLHHNVHWWVVLVGMLMAWIPDTVWIRHFWHERRGIKRTEPVWLTRFHQKIQWFEKPPGIITEIVWLGGMGALLRFMFV